MYFSMDELGFESAEKVKQINGVEEKWRFVYDTAKSYGFEGVHFTPTMYEEFGLSMDSLPDYFQEFKLTLHPCGLWKVHTDEGCRRFDEYMERCFGWATRHSMHDISIHPPYVEGITADERRASLANFDTLVAKWLAHAGQLGITFSLETHVTGKYFLFDGLAEYTEFVDKHPGLGVLIDISHNYYDGFTENEIISIFASRNVTGLHISDALRRGEAEFGDGTHLPIGKGGMDVAQIVRAFIHVPDLVGVFEVKCSDEDLKRSLARLSGLLRL